MTAPVLLFSAFGVLLLMGAPITLALSASAALTYIFVGQELTTLVQIAFSSVNSFPIMALPAFVLAGALMESAGISRRIVGVAEHMIGRMNGGLAITTVLACVFFGAISGSGPATTAAVGMLMIPAMVKRGYAKDYAATAVATSGGIGIIIPPSIPMVIYGVCAQASITKMFLGGVIPGLVFALSLIIVHLILCRGKDLTQGMETFSIAGLVKSLKDGFFAIMAPVLILGGIYSGMFTPVTGMAQAAVLGMYARDVLLQITYITLAKSHSTAFLVTEGLSAAALIVFTFCCFGRWGLTGAGVALMLANVFDMLVIYLYARIRYRYRLSRQAVIYSILHFSIGAAAYMATFAATTALRITLGLATFLASMAVSLYAIQKNTSLLERIKQKLHKK